MELLVDLESARAECGGLYPCGSGSALVRVLAGWRELHWRKSCLTGIALCFVLVGLSKLVRAPRHRWETFAYCRPGSCAKCTESRNLDGGSPSAADADSGSFLNYQA